MCLVPRLHQLQPQLWVRGGEGVVVLRKADKHRRHRAADLHARGDSGGDSSRNGVSVPELQRAKDGQTGVKPGLTTTPSVSVSINVCKSKCMGKYKVLRNQTNTVATALLTCMRGGSGGGSSSKDGCECP
eukprot:TRINITY_DN1025_c1_g1_i1.p1 TRINITY_DN1025_c1_g1~~TRINITY_DN1025_c1_g1_i1.p1  ORF type:complete len:130 (+),score=25.40 TRINITY_DN1025_c1_g1_i1:892-1281(+)